MEEEASVVVVVGDTVLVVCRKSFERRQCLQAYTFTGHSFLSWSLDSQSASGWEEYSTTAWGGIRRRAPSPGQEQHQRLMERDNVCAVCHWPPAAGFIRS